MFKTSPCQRGLPGPSYLKDHRVPVTLDLLPTLSASIALYTACPYIKCFLMSFFFFYYIIVSKQLFSLTYFYTCVMLLQISTNTL